jgi:hypothetical protein
MPMSLPFRHRLLVLVPLSLALPLATEMMTAPLASAAGVLPPADPAASIPSPAALTQACYGGGTVASCQAAALSAIDAARADEGVARLDLPANYGSLPADEQLFVLVDLERVDRGLAPFAGMTPVLDGEAQAGAAGHTDPTGPTTANWSSTVAVGEASALTTDFDWMYDDGPASPNAACPPSCWGHRNAILGNGQLMGAGAVGSAYATVEASDWSETPTFTWAQELPDLAGSVGTSGVSLASAPGTTNTASIPVAASGAPMTFTASVAGAGLSVSPTCTAAAGGQCDLTVTFAPPTAGTYSGAVTVQGPNLTATVAVDALSGHGLWQVASDGGVFDLGGGGFRGSAGGSPINRPVVGMAATGDRGGYWLVAADGGIFSFGDATFHGSTGNLHLDSPIVGMAATPDGGGYWLVAADGGVFSFGDATFHGSTGNLHLNSPIVGMAATPDGGGYWLVGANGGVFSFGDATFHGSTGNLHLDSPIVGMAATPDGGGYRLVAADGGVFDYGDATFHGSAGGLRLNAPVTAIVEDAATGGYWLTAADGGVFNYDAPAVGSLGGVALNRPMVGAAAS